MFNLYKDYVIGEVNASKLGRGLGLVKANGREQNLNQLVFANDTAIVSVCRKVKLRQRLRELGRVCRRRKFSVNERKVQNNEPCEGGTC